MEIDEKRLKRQEAQVQKWITEGGCTAVLEAVTGYGKTFVAILAIKRLHKKYPQAVIDVVVPSNPLYNDWMREKTGHIAVHQLHNVNVFIVNTYIRFGLREISLLIADEIHRFASEEFIRIFEVSQCVKKADWKKGNTMILGLSATLERLDGKHTLIEEYCPVFDTVGMEEAQREGYISNYRIFNWGLELTEEDREEYQKWHDIFNNSFGKFERFFELAMACAKGKNVPSKLRVSVFKENKENPSLSETVMEDIWKTSQEWQFWYAQKQDWDGEKNSFWSPSSIATYAQQFLKSMRNRKTFIYRAEIKFISVVELFKKFNVKTMIFSEDTKFADRITEALGDACQSYHTNITSQYIRVETISKKGIISYKDKKIGKDKVKEMILEDFKKPDGIMAISSIRSLKEGFDYAGVRLVIMASYNSSKREDTQTKGRGTRKDYANLDKTTIIVNLFIKDSQEEKWLKEKQRGTSDIIWVDSIDEINYNTSLFDIEMG